MKERSKASTATRENFVVRCWNGMDAVCYQERVLGAVGQCILFLVHGVLNGVFVVLAMRISDVSQHMSNFDSLSTPSPPFMTRIWKKLQISMMLVVRAGHSAPKTETSLLAMVCLHVSRYSNSVSSIYGSSR